MKKHLHYALYLVLCTFVPFLSLSAAETTLWESTYTDGVEINSETVASFKAGDILRIYLSVPESGANFKICYKGAPDWSETTIPSLDSQWPWVNGGEDHFDLTFTQEDITAFSGKNIYIYQGDNSLISKVTLVTEDQDPEPQDPEPQDPEPQPEPETKEYVDSTVWTGNTAISWNTEEYPGEQFDTYTVQQDMLAGLAKDDSIKIYYTDAIEGAQFALTYKAGENWDWTDLAVTNHTSFFAYKVATDEIAQDIADHGLVIRGQGYHLTSIVIGKPKDTTSGVENTPFPSGEGWGEASKVLRNGQLYIQYNGQMYNVQGQKICF
jgi:hypothetical protein